MDISERKQADEKEKQHHKNIEFLSQTAMQFVEFSPDKDIYRFIGERLKELTGNAAIFINSYDKDTGLLTTLLSLGIGDKTDKILKLLKRHPEGMKLELNEEALLGIKSGVLKKVPGGIYEFTFGEIPESVCNTLEKLLEINSIYVIGFVWNGEITGSASIIMRKGEDIKNPEVIETFIKQASIVLQRRQAEEKLQESEEKFRSITASAQDAIVLADNDGNITYWNEAAEKIFGYTQEEVIGRELHNLLAPTRYYKDYKRGFNKFKETGKGAAVGKILELAGIRKDGTEFPLEISLSSMKLKGEWHATAIIRDISKRKQAEEVQLKQAKKLKILNQVIMSANNANDLQSLLEQILTSTLELMDFDGGGIYLVNENEKIAEVKYSKNLPQQLVDEIKIVKTDQKLYDTIFIKGEPIITDHFEQLDPQRAEKWGIKSLASIPFISKYKIVGAINVASKKRHSFSNEEKDILLSIGRQAGTTIAKMLAEKSLRHKLLVLSQPISNISNLKLTDIIDVDILQELQDKLAEFFDVASIIFDDKGKAITKPSNFSEFCQIIRATEEGNKRCEISDAKLSQLMANGSLALSTCNNFAEIMDGAVPIFIGDRRVAIWGIGQKAVGKISENRVSSYAQKIGADAEKLVAAAKKIKIGSKEQFRKAVTFLEVVAKDISLLGLQNVQQAYDIIKSKKDEQALRESEEKYRLLADNTLDCIWLMDKDFRFNYVNPSVFNMVGFTQEEWIGSTLADYCSEAEKQKIMAIIADALERKETYSAIFEMYLDHKDGRKIPVEITGRILFDNNKNIIGFQGTTRDTSERKQAEEALRRSEEKFRELADLLPQVVFETDVEGNLIYVNQQAFDLFGYSREDFDRGVNAIQTLMLDDRNRAKENMRKILSGENIKGSEYTALRKDGRTFPIIIYSTPIFHENKSVGLRGIIVDISERKRIEDALKESESRFRFMAETTGDVLYRLKYDTMIYDYLSPAISKLTGYSESEINKIGLLNLIKQIVIPGTDDISTENLKSNRIKGKTREWKAEYQIQNKHGELRWLGDHSFPWKDDSGNIIGSVGIMQDITERKQAAEKIKTSLDENVVLLKEIHHRVKNNLQVIISLLYLQSKYFKDKKTLAVFQESQNRIRSMSLIHEKLYQSENLAKINLQYYIKDLANYLFRSYRVDTNNIKLKLNIEDVSLDIDSAIPCGLILNELVSNSLKYAFPKGRAGEIIIELKSEKFGRLELIVKDNGIGLKKDFKSQSVKSLGFRLVNTLVDQLQGRMEIDRNQGAAFRIYFTKKEK